MSRPDSALDEKRVYAESRDATLAYLASDLGVTRVSVSGDQVGRVGLVHRSSARDVAGADGRLFVATEDDVLAWTREGFESTGFGPALAVGIGNTPLAAGPDGLVARLLGDAWSQVGTLSAVRAIDGHLVAADSGVYRVTDGDLTPLGLDGVRDVAASGPFAATEGGLFRRVNGTWTGERHEPCSVVAADGARAHVVADGTILERGSNGWIPCDVPTATTVVDVAYGDATYGVTADGTFLIGAEAAVAADGQGGWRARALGIPSVGGIAVP